MLFVNFDSDADFTLIASELDEPLAPFDLANARVAHRQNYPIAANWKLAVENYCECYHCGPAHPEYSVGHGRSVPESEVDDRLADADERAASLGIPLHRVDKSWLGAERLGHDCNFDRTPFLKDHVTGSRDGRPVAPLLGSITGYDGAATDVHIGPFTFLLAYCDHVVVYRFTPTGKDSSDCEITWLVRGDANEGTDYDKDALTWLWDITTIADKRIIEDNARGIRSRFYQPGPLTPMEDWTGAFLEWYLESLSGSATD
jgi:Rieske 2Fe-2S family protein